jgi:hypothetical protein
MSTVRKHVLIALAALSLGGAAVAAEQQAPAQQGQHHQWTQQERDARRAEFQAKMAEHMKQRAQKLHDALQLTGAQEQAWNGFVASMMPVHHDGAKRGDFRGMANLQAPQRMRKMIELSRQRTAMMESRLSALDSFYSVLSPQQKKVFDEQTSHGMGGHGFGRHGERGEHGQGAMRG